MAEDPMSAGPQGRREAHQAPGRGLGAAACLVAAGAAEERGQAAGEAAAPKEEGAAAAVESGRALVGAEEARGDPSLCGRGNCSCTAGRRARIPLARAWP